MNIKHLTGDMWQLPSVHGQEPSGSLTLPDGGVESAVQEVFIGTIGDYALSEGNLAVGRASGEPDQGFNGYNNLSAKLDIPPDFYW